jgi:hypothetical protein
MGNEGEDHFEILASSLERQRVSAVAGGKLELPGQGVPKLELGNEGIFDAKFYFPSPCGRGLRRGGKGDFASRSQAGAWERAGKAGYGIRCQN